MFLLYFLRIPFRNNMCFWVKSFLVRIISVQYKNQSIYTSFSTKWTIQINVLNKVDKISFEFRETYSKKSWKIIKMLLTHKSETKNTYKWTRNFTITLNFNYIEIVRNPIELYPKYSIFYQNYCVLIKWDVFYGVSEQIYF
jgi:hypothetical protein